MFNKAITKLKDEMDKNKNNSYVQVVGDFLIQHVQINPDTAEKILDKDKTISQSLNEMKKAAEKKKIGNCAVLTDSEGFTVILKYFEINGNVSVAYLMNNISRLRITE